MIQSLGFVSNPHQALIGLDVPCCVTFDFSFHQRHTSDKREITLTALCLLSDANTEFVVVPGREVALIEGRPDLIFRKLIDDWGVASVSFSKPWPLETVDIIKPWGSEIWYTGIESRGVCTVQGMPLPWLLALHPEQSLGSASYLDPILLKILDPHPEEAYGDLYFELHETKIEVYVVTHVDRAAWPDGTGQIRYGFNPGKVSEYDETEKFKADYLNAVEAYRQVRDEIDQQIEIRKSGLGMSPSDPIQPELLDQWKSELDSTLQLQEARLRDEMYSFTNLQPIRVGDVVRVNPYFPHSLQHGVRVIEFQTAHYERHILSFNQKVVTQDHWDTKKALENAIVDQPADNSLALVAEGDGCRVESVANFPEFNAFRITMVKGATYHRSMTGYALVIGVSGTAIANGTPTSPEQGFFVPAAISDLNIIADTDTTLLIAEPN